MRFTEDDCEPERAPKRCKTVSLDDALTMDFNDRLTGDNPEILAHHPMLEAETDVSFSEVPSWFKSAHNFVIDATFTKHVTQKFKKFLDGTLFVNPRTGFLRLRDEDGMTVQSVYLTSSLGAKWNAAFQEGGTVSITKPFHGLLVNVVKPPYRLSI